MRALDEICDYIRRCEQLSPTERQVMINRLLPRPSAEERELARRQVPDTWR